MLFKNNFIIAHENCEIKSQDWSAIVLGLVQPYMYLSLMKVLDDGTCHYDIYLVLYIFKFSLNR